MTLDYPTPAAVAAGVRLRLRSIPKDSPLLLVEGTTDRSTLARVLHPGVVVVAASNKEKVLGARALLTESEVSRCTFLVDCDGDSDTDWQARPDVVFTDFRDIDADAALALGGLWRVIADHIAPRHDTGESLEVETNGAVAFAVAVTTLCGVVTDAARTHSLPTRVLAPDNNGRHRRRRIRADDLADFPQWVSALTAPKLVDSMVAAVASGMDWNQDQQQMVRSTVATRETKPCRLHGAGDCRACMPRRFVNGHDLAAVLSALLRLRYQIETQERLLLREVRLSVDDVSLSSWRVVRRLEERGRATARPYLR